MENKVKAEELIAAEVERQADMWGSGNGRADVSNGQLHRAAIAQLISLFDKQCGIDIKNAFDKEDSFWFPQEWSVLHDYGSDIANLVVAAAYITQEIRRKLRAGEDTTRTAPEADQEKAAES